jgi:hypothetical protein
MNAGAALRSARRRRVFASQPARRLPARRGSLCIVLQISAFGRIHIQL